MTKRITILEIAPALDVFYDIQKEKTNGSVSLSDGNSTIQGGTKFRPVLRQHPGGKGINVARVLARLMPGRQADIRVDLHLFCKDDPLTGAIVELLRADRKLRGKVNIVHHPVGIRQVRVCANAAITRGGKMVQEFNFSPYVGIEEQERRKLLEHVHVLNRSGDWVVLAGTPPAIGHNHGTDALLYRNIAARLSRTNLVLDTSGPSLDHCLKAGFRHLKAVKINDEEALESADALRSFGGLRIITSERGAVVHRGKKRLGMAAIAKYPPIRFTLGAGDTMMAGFLLRYLRTEDPLEAATYGQAAALALVSSSAGICAITPRRVEKYLSHLARQ